MIRTGQLLAEIAQSLGYELIGIDLFRTRLATATREQLREEVVVLRWPGAVPASPMRASLTAADQGNYCGISVLISGLTSPPYLTAHVSVDISEHVYGSSDR